MLRSRNKYIRTRSPGTVGEEKNKERNLDNISFLMKCFGRETERGGKREKEKIDRQPGHMTTDVECQEFQKRGERKWKREREIKRERDILQTCIISISTFSQSHTPLFLLSLHMWVSLSPSLSLSFSLSLSLSLSLCVCVYECGRVLVCCPFLIPSSSLSNSLSRTYTHTVEQSKIIDVKQLRDCSQKKNSKRVSLKHLNTSVTSHVQTLTHKKRNKLTEYTSIVCLV